MNMKPDNYSTSSATPRTALAAWIGICNVTQKEIAERAFLARKTAAVACKGGGVRQGTAVLLGHATGLSPDVIRAGELRHAWTFDLDADGNVAVLS